METQEIFSSKIVKHTLFPFNIVPTIVEVTDEHVLVTHRQLLGTSQEQSIPMSEIHNVSILAGLFTENLTIMHGAPQQELCIGRFRSGDAQEIADRIRKAIDESQKKK